ncbi:phospholipase C, phosphocholine-specific, partial [Amycolatopsis rhizosphaerae]
MPRLSRRRLLGVSGAALAGSLLPPSLHAAMAQPMPKGGLDAVEHVIVLMQENRSFDHYFGSLRGARGFGDAHPLDLRGGGPVFAQPKPGGGSVLPFSLREEARREGRGPGDIQYLGALDHSWTGTGAAWARGWNDGWIAAKGAATMTFYDRTDIPLQYELADTFTLCDAYHCSIFGSTNPNRNFLWTGTVGREPLTGLRAVTNAAYSYDHPGYDWTTYPERLEQAGVPWQIYQEWDNFTDNAVEYFKPFKKIGKKMLASVEGGFRTTEEFYDKLFGRTAEEQQKLLRQLDAGRALLSPAERSLFDRAMYRSEPGTLVSRLRADIAGRRLPAVSWLVPSAADSEHPGSSTPVGSARLIYDVLDAIASDPHTWSKTVLLINFDENDGYFDHVPP